VSAGRVILVDDEEDIRLATGQTLELEGHDVTTFARGDRALERIGRDFDGILVSDIRMPVMDGLELLRAARERDPELPVILITGHGDVPLAVEAIRAGAYDFVQKPFDPKPWRTGRCARSLSGAIHWRLFWSAARRSWWRCASKSAPWPRLMRTR
jgi:two-component system C4-dicarboxylate transport response regulator DctD